MRKIFRALAAFAGIALASTAVAAPVFDGTKDALYGAPLYVQTTETQFGDSNGSFQGTGGELNALYATNTDNFLYVMITGNHERGGNMFVLYIDHVEDTSGTNPAGSAPGGIGGLGEQPWGDYNGGNSGELRQIFPASFDGFEYGVAWKWFDNAGDNIGVFWADFTTSTSVFSGDTPLTVAGTTHSHEFTDPHPLAGLAFFTDNANSAGVIGGTGAANAAAAEAVTTGAEIAIPRSMLDNIPDGDSVRLAAAYTGGNGDFWSNQILPGLLMPQGNLANTGHDLSQGSKQIGPAMVYTFAPPTSVPSWDLY